MNNLVKNIVGIEIYQNGVPVHAPDKVTRDGCLLKRFRGVTIETVLLIQRNVYCLSSILNIQSSPSIVTVPDGIVNGYLLWQMRRHPRTHQSYTFHYYARFLPSLLSTSLLFFSIGFSALLLWSTSHKQCPHSILNLLSSSVIFCTFSPKIIHVPITDASAVRIDTIVGHGYKLVIFVPRHWSKVLVPCFCCSNSKIEHCSHSIQLYDCV